MSGSAPQTGQLAQEYIFYLSILATVGLAIMWIAFWVVVYLRRENVGEILLSSGFFQTVVVMGVIAATVVLSLAGRLDSDVTGAILSGIVGYVLGRIAGHGKPESGGKLTDTSLDS
jgi:hypothetical protein